LKTNLVVIVRDAATRRPLAYQYKQAAKILVKDPSDHLQPRLSTIQDQKHSHFVDAHFQDGARRAYHSILPKKEANTMIIDNHDKFTF
jgi:hypothetical protein